MEKEENVAPKMLEKTEVDFEPVDEPVEAFYDNENGISEQSRFHHSFENTYFKVKHFFLNLKCRALKVNYLKLKKFFKS